jgi:hypothetical protein
LVEFLSYIKNALIDLKTKMFIIKMSCVVEYYSDMAHYMRRMIHNSSHILDEDIFDITDNLIKHHVEVEFRTNNGLTSRHFKVIKSSSSEVYRIRGKNIHITILFN